MTINYLMIALFALACGFFAYNSYRRLAPVRMAKKENRFDNICRRIKSVIFFAFAQKRILKYRLSGILHLTVFWGFLVLSSGVICSAADLFFGIDLIQFFGKLANLYINILLFTEYAVALAVLIMLGIRLAIKPKRLTLNADGIICLLFILSIMVAGIQYKTVQSQELSRYLEYAHLFFIFGFLNYLPFSKHFHLITAIPNIFFRSFEPTGKIPAMDMNDESIWEMETQKDFNRKELTWKGVLDLASCTECGRCDESCPAYASGKDLSPKKIIRDLRKEGVIAPKESWECLTCGACQNSCPIFIEHVSKIITGRRFEAMINGQMPQELQLSLDNIIDAEGNIKLGNPYGGSKESRECWIGGLPVKKIYENKDCDILFWVGCNGAYNGRIQKITQKFAETMIGAGINFGILGKEELCCGEWIRRIGNEYLYQIIAQKNIEALKEYKVKQIVTFCPHCFNTLKNEYPEFGGNFNVLHHTQFMIENKLIPYLPTDGTKSKKVVYHDPCYLGRHNNIYNEPRKILRSRLEVQFKEIKQSGANSFCCGGGGGQSFMEEHGKKKINGMRLDQLLEARPDIIATSCPFCLTMIDDALKAKGADDIKVQDIIEI